MRLSKREVTDIAKLREILEACKTVRIACVDDQGLFIVPMSFGFELDDETRRLSLWLHSAGEGRKAAAWKSAGDAGCPVAIEMDIEDGVIRRARLRLFVRVSQHHGNRHAPACHQRRRQGLRP